MKAKAIEHAKAIALREKGFSLNEISSHLKISKSTASLWLRTIPLSTPAKKEIHEKRTQARLRANATHREHTDNKISLALHYGRSVVQGVDLTPDTSRLLFALLYWCEGAKIRRGNTFAFTNSDPELIATFMRLFREGFAVDEERLRLNLHVHDYHDSDKQLQFWSKLTNIPLAQCHKPYRKLHTGRRTREGYQGCVSIRYHDVTMARQVESIAMVFLRKGP